MRRKKVRNEFVDRSNKKKGENTFNSRKEGGGRRTLNKTLLFIFTLFGAVLIRLGGCGVIKRVAVKAGELDESALLKPALPCGCISLLGNG